MYQVVPCTSLVDPILSEDHENFELFFDPDDFLVYAALTTTAEQDRTHRYKPTDLEVETFEIGICSRAFSSFTQIED